MEVPYLHTRRKTLVGCRPTAGTTTSPRRRRFWNPRCILGTASKCSQHPPDLTPTTGTTNTFVRPGTNTFERPGTSVETPSPCLAEQKGVVVSDGNHRQGSYQVRRNVISRRRWSTYPVEVGVAVAVKSDGERRLLFLPKTIRRDPGREERRKSLRERQWGEKSSDETRG